MTPDYRVVQSRLGGGSDRGLVVKRFPHSSEDAAMQHAEILSKASGTTRVVVERRSGRSYIPLKVVVPPLP